MNRRKIHNFGPAGINHPGFRYLIKLLTLCLLRGFKNDRKFKLSTGNKHALGFNKIIFETTDGAILMTTNYRDSTKSKPLSYRELFQRYSLGGIHENLRFFSGIDRSTFRIKNARCITNIRISRSKAMESVLPSNDTEVGDVLYCAQKGVYYTLGGNCREVLRDERDIAEGILSDFLEKFQLMPISERALDEEIRSVLRNIEICDSEYLNLQDTANYLDSKITAWFSDIKSCPLENYHAAAFLSTRRSTNYAKTLQRHEITFRRPAMETGNRVLHLVSGRHYVLTLIRFYREAIEKPDACIIVDPNERLSVQRVMVEAFFWPECPLLVVPLYGAYSYNVLRIHELLEGISGVESKRIVFFADEDNFSENVPNVQVINTRTCFDDLEDACRKAFLDATVDFQGTDVPLRDVLAPNGDAKEIIDEETMLKLSLGEKIRIEKLRGKGETGSTYIGRTFIRDGHRCSERDICDSFVATRNANKFTLISDDAGMGKSTALTRIAEILTEPQYPRFWVVRLDLNRYSNVFRKLKQNATGPIEVEDVLNSAGPVIRTDFERKLFNVRDKVVLLIDGMDVVGPSYENLAMQFLKSSSVRTNIARIVLTTRPYLESLLERELRVKRFKLQLFSNADRLDFLATHWKINLNLSQRDAMRAKSYARSLIEKLDRKIGRASLDFVGIPLQTRMIAEIFQQGGGYQNSEWKGCREFLASPNLPVDLNADINIAKLYEMFVLRKGEMFVDDNCTSGHVVVEDVVQKLFQESIDAHKKIALESCVDSEKCRHFAVYRDTNIDQSKQHLSNLGLVQLIDRSWVFVHRTFGEYFVSACLWDELKAGNVEWPFLRFLLSDVLVSVEYSVVRSFFDSILANEDFSEGVLAACGRATSQISWNENRNVVHLAREGRLNILKLLLEKCSNLSYLLQIVDVSGGGAIHEATQHPRLLEYLVLKGANVDKVNSLGQSALHKACQNDNCAEVVGFLISNGADIEIKTKDGKSPLHLAAESNSLEIARQLVDAGANVLATTGNGRTALDLAQSCKNGSMVEMLKKKLASL